MRIAVNLQVYREKYPRLRKARRLAYLAAIARNRGHEVVIHETVRQPDWPFSRVIDGIEKVAGRPVRADRYVCDQGVVTETPECLPDCPVVCYRSYLGARGDADLERRCWRVVHYAWRPEDYWNRNGRARVLESLAGRSTQVPFLVQDDVLGVLERDGIEDAFLADDLAAIRERYGAEEKLRHVAFRGYPWPWRRDIAAECGCGWSFEWAEAGKSRHVGEVTCHVRQRVEVCDQQVQGAEYLRWLSQCRAVLCLPGETWNCSRLMEAVMMGVPAVVPAGRFRFNPEPSAQNCILADSFADPSALVACAAPTAELIAGQDAAYRAGWSLAGQFKTIVEAGA